ncbi:MAG: MFS transporter [Streptosporangiales bacterium]|nr:MFS transporter [Streptosporangiales bacterium]
MAQVIQERRGLGAARNAGISAEDRAPFGWAPFVVLFLVGLVDRVEHSLLSGVLPLIQAEWGFSDTLAGSIPTAGAIAAALVVMPAGYLADRYNRTRIIAVVVFVWALATMGSGLAAGFAMFYMMRVVLAAAENIDNPASGSLLADYYPQVNRPKVFGWVRITSYLGGLGTILGGVLGQALGWRTAFMIMVVPGILVAVLAWFLKEPPRGFLDRVAAVGSKEPTPVPKPAAAAKGGAVEGIAKRMPGPHFKTQLKDVLRVPTLVLVGFSIGLLTIGVAGVFFWLPSLIVRRFGEDAGTAATISGLITLVGVIAGTAIGSYFAPRVHSRFKGGMLVLAGAGITVGASLLFVVLRMPSLLAYGVLLVISVAIMSISIPTATAALADTVPADSRGLGFALLQFLLTGGTALGPLTVGVLSDLTGSLLTGISLTVSPLVIGGLFTLVLGRRFYDRDAARVLEAARGETPPT